MWPSDLSPDDTIAIVDARRVGTLEDFPFWLCVLPTDSVASTMVVDVIRGRQLCSTPAGIRVDGFRPTPHFQARPGVRTVTLLSGAARECHCVAVNSDPFSRFPDTRTFPLTPLSASTTTTTSVHGRPFCSDVTIALAAPQCRMRAVRMAPHDDLVAVLEQLILPSCVQHPAYTGGSIIACQRVYRGRDGETLVYCAFESHDPFARNVWVDIRLESRSLHMMALEHRVTCAQILQRAGVTTRCTPLLFVDGVRCHDGIKARDGSVVTICRRKTQAVSDSLGRAALRHPALQCFVRQLDLPRAVPATHAVTQTDLYHPETFRRGLRSAIEHNVQTLGLVPQQSQAIIASAAFGAIPVGCGSGTPVDAATIDARAHEIWYALDINRVTDTKQVFNDCCVYLARESRSTEIFWFLLDQSCPDVFALARDIDPAIGIPCPEGLAVDVVRRGPGWGLFRLVPAGMELRNCELVDQLDVNDLSSLDSQDTARMFATPDSAVSVSSASPRAAATVVSDAEQSESSSLLQVAASIRRAPAPSAVLQPGTQHTRTSVLTSRATEPSKNPAAAKRETTLSFLAEAQSGARAARLSDSSNGSSGQDLAPSNKEHSATTVIVYSAEVPRQELPVPPNATFGQVLAAVAGAQRGSTFVPVFPQEGSSFECILFTPDVYAHSIPAVVFNGTLPSVVMLHAHQTSSSVCQAAGLPPGNLWVSGKPWSEMHESCVPGSRIHFQPLDGDTKTALQHIATPCRASPCRSERMLACQDRISDNDRTRTETVDGNSTASPDLSSLAPTQRAGPLWSQVCKMAQMSS